MKLYTLPSFALFVLAVSFLYLIISVFGSINEADNYRSGVDEHGYPVAIRK